MKNIVAFTREAKRDFCVWVVENCRDPEKQCLEAWLDEAFEKCSGGNGMMSDYEMGSAYSRTGNPITYSFTANSFEYEEEEEEN